VPHDEADGRHEALSGADSGDSGLAIRFESVWPSGRFPKGGIEAPRSNHRYRTVPAAALRDPFLFELLALIDALRGGRARERTLAERELTRRLREHDA
jgi:hypothetical protein